MSLTNIPEQSIPRSEKDQEWREETLEAYIDQANFKLGANSYRQHLLKLYDYYNGKIDHSDYEYVLQPYGKKRENFPAQIRNFPLIKPSIDLLVGEKAKRPFNFTVVVESDDVQTVKNMEMTKKVNENLQKWFVKKLNDAGFETGMEQDEEPELPENVKEVFERNWRDHRAIMAQNALEYLIPYLKYRQESQKAWFDFLVSGYAFTHRGVENGEPFYETLNPLDVDYDKDPNTEYVEDGNWVVIRKLVSRSSVIDKFRKTLSKQDIERLQAPRNTNRDVFFWYNQDENVFHDEWDNYTELVTVYWKSLRKVGFRTYQDETGEVYEEVVDESYEFNPETDIDLEWDWVNHLWKGHRVDGDMYFDIEPVKMQRSSIDNPSKCKLPVNGRAYSDRNSSNISLVELGIPYQLSYNIFKYRLENAIAKSKDILALLDIEMIPKGWSMDKFMQILEATGIAWVNYQKEGMQFNPQHQSVLDMSIKTIEQYIALLQHIKEEWEYVSGISRQRMGQVSPYEGKATGEQAIIQSSHITEEFYRRFSELEQRDLQALIDYAQVAWVDGKKSNYIGPDGYEKFLEVQPENFIHEEFGVFVKDANKEKEKLDQIKALGQSFIQNGTPMSMIADMIDSENFAEMKEMIKKAERKMQELNEQQQKMEQQQQQAELQDKQKERDLEREKNVRDNQTKVDVALIKEEFDDSDISELTAQQLEQRKIALQEKVEQAKVAEEKRSNKADEKLREKEIQVKKKQAQKSNNNSS